MEDGEAFALRRIGTVRRAAAEGQHSLVRARLELHFEGSRAALRELGTFDRCWVLYWMHRAKPFGCGKAKEQAQAQQQEEQQLVEIPVHGDKPGTFATRCPRRPNPVGLSCVHIVSVDVDACVVEVDEADMLDGTPVLDIKPYVPRFDAFPDSRAGWFDNVAPDWFKT
eukprot:TRINITY_DN18359_c0_g1_i1.p3 TRINITY_DN18359_c0_g1~~TRINITY_DN18359_c0_g1_i1.p3  ORF type:complete len:177 (-),score=46.49 TRINITY_DN18359_c0_g1_i1:35-538(-)